MSAPLAAAFGNLSYNFLVKNAVTLVDEIIFCATVSGGKMVDRLIDQPCASADFDFTMLYNQYIAGIEDPHALLVGGLLGSTIFINDLAGTGIDPETLFAGVRTNNFLIEVPEPATRALLAFGLLGLLVVASRAKLRTRGTGARP